MFERHKIQKDTCTSDEEYKNILIRVILVYVFICIPILYLYWIYVMPYRLMKGMVLNTQVLILFIVGFIACVFIADASSWLIHKGMHYFPFIYENIHQFHHRHIAPVALASIDAYPLEVIIWDLFPLFLGPFIIGADPAFTMFFGIFGVVQTLAAHCGYDLGLYFDGRFHDLHHEKMKCNYGGNVFMDYIMGTYIERENNKVYPKWNATEKTLYGSNNIYCKNKK
jgi:sterol desaturase/sphingolipid hydroxylase (fatty acid hydroxylase superfamily)